MTQQTAPLLREMAVLRAGGIALFACVGTADTP